MSITYGQLIECLVGTPDEVEHLTVLVRAIDGQLKIPVDSFLIEDGQYCLLLDGNIAEEAIAERDAAADMARYALDTALALAGSEDQRAMDV